MVEGALPAGQTHLVVSSSDDWNQQVIRSTGDREAGSYYLLSNGKELMPLGRAYPHLDPAKLSDMRYVEYAARDGLTVPGYLTLPRYGEAPYPAVVLPHGGPWARDYWGWDAWVQFLANRGYAVLQPNYRGSSGFGQKLWRAGDREWGQKMQDDKDDGAAWLVDEGIAHADRIAIFGYSYGGYAAMAAAVRPNSPFQCAIAGAGLSELRTFDKITFENPFTREYQNPTVAGLSPLDHVKSANIPIYLFHGDRDQRVPVEQSRKYYRALRRAGATVEYNEITDLWHSLPWWPTHHMNLFENLEDYLANRCGPGGL
ncbi:MAG: alpha/beta fold hydrolase [Gammaproteobacteria bacterium]|nr:alpha/beta fold hydrolase [Gammaproteobacteria bacterium]